VPCDAGKFVLGFHLAIFNPLVKAVILKATESVDRGRTLRTATTLAPEDRVKTVFRSKQHLKY
jgi:hypothetical protein